MGDNIYQPLPNNTFSVIPNINHPPQLNNSSCNFMKHDLDGVYVLISDEFYYFGENAYAIPAQYKINVPKAQSGYGAITQDPIATSFIDHIMSNFKTGIIGFPHGFYHSCVCKPTSNISKSLHETESIICIDDDEQIRKEDKKQAKH